MFYVIITMTNFARLSMGRLTLRVMAETQDDWINCYY